MKWFRNLKIRSKLILCFVILSIITTGVGAFGIYNMNTINQSSENMYHNNFIPVTNLKDVVNNLQQVRANILLAVYEQNPETLQTRLDEITKYVETNNKLLETYEKSIVSEKENELYNNVLNSLSEYRTVREANLELMKNNQYDLALEELGKVTDARVKTDEAVQQLVDYNTNHAAETLQTNKDNFTKQTNIMITVIVIGLFFAIFLGLMVANMISKQLKKLVGVANKIADGDLDVVIDVHTKDEVGILGNAFHKMADNLNNVMSNINAASDQVSTGARQVSESSIALSQGATEQASSVEELTASLEEISSQTKFNAQNANQANELAESAKLNAVLGNDQMKEMLKAMEEINESSSNISKIIKVIDEIAFQTNILALNAAVEAARAGQHGKGFAVVAEEVRNLAARSANAAKETTDMIESSIKKVEGGTNIARDTAEALNKIVKGVEKVAKLVNDIAIASNEQATGIAQINQGIMQVSEVVQTNSATSEESAAASEELSSQAGLLKEMVSKFHLRQEAKTYGKYDELRPEVLKMLDNMSAKADITHKITENDHKDNRSKAKISLSDNEYGKY